MSKKIDIKAKIYVNFNILVKDWQAFVGIVKKLKWTIFMKILRKNGDWESLRGW
jgi:hypothetical protein